MSKTDKIPQDESLLLDHLNSLADSTWIGQGQDTFPTPNGPVITEYSETMTMGPTFKIINGDPNTGQVLWCAHYYTQLANAVTGVAMHQETGYWMFNFVDGTFRKAVSIPRGIAILAGGTFVLTVENGLVMKAAAASGSSIYGISNEPYLNQYAQTQSFTTTMSQTNDTYTYSEDSVLDIMGQKFNHTDKATLHLQP